MRVTWAFVDNNVSPFWPKAPCVFDYYNYYIVICILLTDLSYRKGADSITGHLALNDF